MKTYKKIHKKEDAANKHIEKIENRDGVARKTKKNGNFLVEYWFPEEIYLVRYSDHIQDDIKRNWSSWSFGGDGFEGTEQELLEAKSYAIENEMSFDISGFELWGNDIEKADIRELYSNYWVLVDNVNAEGGLSCHFFPIKIQSVKDALKEIKSQKSIYDGTGDGDTFDARVAKLVYSKGRLHIFTTKD